MWIGILIGVLVLLIIGFVVFLYNKLVRYRNRVENAWHQIDVQLNRRADLIPNLVETVKGYASHERETLEGVTKARTAMMNASTVGENAQAEGMLSGALKNLFAVAEAYPDLKANQNFLALQEELSGTENKIAYARQFYNDSVMSYDIARQKFPANVIAGMFKFTEKREYFEPETPDYKEVPKVSF
ncbi:MAG: LemA family protein [Actinobacteria bacterium]|nr:LemA family protein [Actinomycetota bacterium]MCG2818717.1 LemA family protein [Actinomycetes bacterium]MBU4178608.1 LemA family protein [Actinomycetota bacterium]MBU4218613.1 LemA family protein [Actinomycetota bacterium]MBU4359877.1 LemA family protein [Actinomycetota bacterium]